MSKVIEPLKCSIHKCGTPFVVTDLLKSTILQPGSTGVLSHVMGPDYNNPNIVFQSAVISRRGKGGKIRLDVNTILTPIFEVPDVFFKKVPPKRDSKKFFIDINPNNDASLDSISQWNIESNEIFIPWLLSKCLLLKKLDKISYTSQNKDNNAQNDIKSIYIWPTDRLDVLNKFIKDISYLVNNGEFEDIRERYGNAELRITMVDKLRVLEHSLSLAELEYQYKVNCIKLAALKYISNCVQSNIYEINNVCDFKRSLRKTRRITKTQRDLINNLIAHRLSVLTKHRKTTSITLQ